MEPLTNGLDDKGVGGLTLSVQADHSADDTVPKSYAELSVFVSTWERAAVCDHRANSLLF